MTTFSKLFMKNDQELLIEIKQDNPIAFAQLYERYKNTILAKCHHYLNNSFDSDTVMQDVFTTFWLKKELFNTKENLNDSLLPLLLHIAKNKCLDLIRQHQRMVNVVSDCENVEIVDSTENDLYEQRNKFIKEIIEKIPAISIRTAIKLRYLGELKKTEMLKLMNVDIRTFDTYVSRGNAILRKLVKERKSY